MTRLCLSAFLMLAMATAACGDGDTPARPSSTPAPATAAASATPDTTPEPGSTSTVAATPSAASATSTPPAPNGETGIAGIITVGPTCPVERAVSPCPDRPLAARITVWRGSTLVAETRSGDDGAFRILVGPGEYRVVGESENVFPAGGEQAVTVTPGAITTISVRYDSGIR